jgi:superfamily I DNA/RNA helicase
MSTTWWIKHSDLDREQRKVVELPATGSYLVSGPPGSGKTNLLLLRAAHVLGTVERPVRVLSFTRSLKEFMASGCGEYKLNPEYVSTYESWARDILKNAGHPFPAGDFDARRKQTGVLLRQIAVDAPVKRYHTLFVDEAQDYQADELHAISELADYVFFVADSRQSIYSGGSSLQIARALVSEEIRLDRHYRNGLRICELADAVSYGETGTYRMMDGCNYDERRMPSQRQVKNLPTFDDQLRFVEAELGTLRNAYPNEFIGVLAPRRNQVARVADALTQSPFSSILRLVKDDDSGFGSRTKRIVVSTIHSAKGLEFRAVILLGLEDLVSPFLVRNVLFTGITRAKTSLYILYSGRCPTDLDLAVRRLDGAPNQPHRFEDLFPSRGSDA